MGNRLAAMPAILFANSVMIVYLAEVAFGL